MTPQLNMNCPNLLGNGIQAEITELKTVMLDKVRDVKTTLLENLPQISSNLKEGAEIKNIIRGMKIDFSTMSTSYKHFNDILPQLINQTMSVNAKCEVMWKNQYRNMLPTEVPLHKLSEPEVEDLKEQSFLHSQLLNYMT